MNDNDKTMQTIIVAIVIITLLLSGGSYLSTSTLSTKISDLSETVSTEMNALDDTIVDLISAEIAIASSVADLGTAVGASTAELSAIEERLKKLEEATEPSPITPIKDTDNDGVPDNLDEFPGRDDSIFKTTLYIGSRLESGYYDAGIQTSTQVMCITRQIYEGLLEYEGSTNILKPLLAKAWDVSEDGLTYTFYLEENIKFHDGTPFNAEAVKYSYDRVIGIGRGNLAFFSDIDEIEVIDEFTVQFNMKATSSTFLLRVASLIHKMIMSPTYVKAHSKSDDTWAEDWMHGHTCGTGPYTMEEWVPEEHILLEKFDDYWQGWDKAGDENGNYIETIFFKIVREASTAKLMIEKGDLDTAEKVLFEDFVSLNNTDGITVSLPLYTKAFMIQMNLQTPLLSDVRVRQAIASVLKYEDVANILMLGMTERARGPIPTALAPYHSADLEWYDYDIEKAKALMKDAGYEGDTGVVLKYTYLTGYEDCRQIGVLLMSGLNEIGIGIELSPVSSTQWRAEAAAGSTDLYALFNTGRIFDPDALLTPLIGLEKIPPVGRNLGRYTNERAEELLLLGREELDIDKRIEYYNEIQQILRDDAIEIDIHNKPIEYLHRDWVKGRVYHPAYARSHNVYNMYKEGVPGGN